MHKHQSFLMGFGCCFLFFLALLCFLIEIGHTERGSGRRKIEKYAYAFAASSASEPVGQQKPDRKPDKGSGRKDANN